VQNVHVMRPEVRAEYERAAAALADAPEAFHRRLERFFTELRDPLYVLFGEDPRFPAHFDDVLAAMARTAAARDPELRALDHERSSARASWCATSARACTKARNATSPTTTCSWCCCGARSPPGACR
jgi:outer membrane protein TolC